MLWLLWALSMPDERSPHREAGEAADLEAVRRMSAGDGEALAQLYDRHARAVYSLALRVLGDGPEAEEVTQDVFAQAWRQSSRYDTSRGAVVAWLLMMSRSRAINRLRSRRGLPPASGDTELTLGLLPDRGEGPEHATLTTERARLVRRGLETLPLVQRMAIELAFYEGLTHVEIAERLEVPLGTIKTRIRLGLMKLKETFLVGGQAAAAGGPAVTGSERDRVAELASLHALGVLTAEERTELAQAAGADAQVRAEVQALERTALALAQTVPQINPPAALRARVLASVAGAPSAAERRGVPMRPRARVLPAWLAAAAALVAAMGLGLWALQLRGALLEMSARVDAAESEVIEIRRTLGQEREQVRVLQARADVLFAPDMVRVDLAGQSVAPNAAARAFWSRRKGMTFSASALPLLPATKVYQVWVLTATQPPISAGLITPDAQGGALVHFATPEDVPTPVALAVTLEPAGGVPQPTGDKVLVGQVGN